MQTAHFEAQSGYSHQVRPIIYPYDDRRPFILNAQKYNPAQHLKSPQQLLKWQEDTPIAINAIREIFAESNYRGEIIGLCALSYLHITDCGLKDLNNKIFLADITFPPCCVLWGLESMSDNNVPLIQPNTGYGSVQIDSAWGKYLVQPPVTNPFASEHLQKTA